jgi:endo-1,4-beta-xylanase
MTRWNRRDVIGAGLAGASLATHTAFAARREQISLDALARRKGLRFGTALGGRGLSDEKYLAIVRAECGIVVPENALKMPTLQPSFGEFRFERADSLFAFAEANAMRVRGHTFLWHHPRWMPRWLDTHDFGAQPATAAATFLSDHITRTATHFGKRIASWDVVNEAIDNVTGVMRETVLSKAMGAPDKVIDLAFHTARAALPDTELVYNDYMGWETNSGPHRDGVLRLLERMRRDGVPVDALGIQAHIGSGNQDANASRVFDARDERAWRAFLDEVTGMGYRLLITEFDVHDATVPGDLAARDRKVAGLGRAFLDICLDYRQLSELLCWGLADNHSWLQGRTPREDGTRKRPTPYDDQYRPKALREEIAAALRSAPKRKPA